MNTTQFAQGLMERSKEWATSLLTDLRSDPLARPAGGNHAVWLAGHLAFSESSLLDVCILGGENRFPEWETLFRHETTPGDDASAYPSLDTLLEAWNGVRSAALAHLATLSDDDLDTPSHDLESGPMFDTVGACFGAMSMHAMHHAGQAADARRAAGRQPMMA